MRKPGGFTFITTPDGKVEEGDAFTCYHCQRIVMVPSKAKPDDIGGFCTICTRLVCPSCVGKPCDPFEEKLKRMEASYHARRSYGE